MSLTNIKSVLLLCLLAVQMPACKPRPITALSMPDIGTLGNQTGEAIQYPDRLHGLATASGATYDTSKFTAAHRTLPFGSKVVITNLSNGSMVTVKINDRGPAAPAQIICVSKAAARKLQMLHTPVVQVRIRFKE